MERRTVIAIAIITGLLGFCYGSSLDTLNSNPLTWIAPALGLAFVLYMMPGITLLAVVDFYGLPGADLPQDNKTLLLLVAVSALCWLAAGAYVWFRRATYIP